MKANAKAISLAMLLAIGLFFALVWQVNWITYEPNDATSLSRSLFALVWQDLNNIIIVVKSIVTRYLSMMSLLPHSCFQSLFFSGNNVYTTWYFQGITCNL